jgi:hypothetical protein
VLKSLFVSDKAPFILSVTLSILGWLITTTIANLSDVVVIGVAETVNAEKATFGLTNHSTKKSFVGGLMTITCLQGPCFKPNNERRYARLVEIAPYAIKGTRVCSDDSVSITAMLSLPPSAKVQIEANLAEKADPRLMFNGLVTDETSTCPTSSSSLKVDNIWIVKEGSLIIFLLDYYYHFLSVFIVLTAVFLVVILLKPQPAHEADDAV